jgi:hypothetical protein
MVFMPVGGKGAMYSRTQNEDGSYNTRCLDCFFTIAASVATEAELDRVEAGHMCPEKVLAALLAERMLAAESAPRG